MSDAYACVGVVNSCISEECLPPKIFYDIWDVLFKWNHVNALVYVKHGSASQHLLVSILNHVASRTILFAKTFECIPVDEFLTVDPSCCIFGVGASKNTVIRGIDQLIKDKLIIPFFDYTGKRRFLGLDLYNIVLRLWGLIKKCTCITQHRISKSKEILKGLIQSKPFVFITKRMQSLCGVILPKNLELIKDKVIELGLSSSILDIVNGRASALDSKRETKALKEVGDTPQKVIVSEKDARNFLVNWKKLIVESGLFPNYHPNDELNVRGLLSKVKSFLRAEYEDGKTWEDLKEDLKSVIDGWGRVPVKQRRLSGISSKGKPYSVDLKECPDFVTYYEQRAAVRQVCRKHSQYKKKEIVDYVVPKQESIKPVQEESDVDFEL